MIGLESAAGVKEVSGDIKDDMSKLHPAKQAMHTAMKRKVAEMILNFLMYQFPLEYKENTPD